MYKTVYNYNIKLFSFKRKEEILTQMLQHENEHFTNCKEQSQKRNKYCMTTYINTYVNHLE